MGRKIIFFDIDGTLLNHEKELPATTFEALQQLQERGHLIAIATGRPPFIFEDLREILRIETYVSMNGQLVVHDNEIIYKNPIEMSKLQQLTDFSKQKQHPLVFVNDKKWGATDMHHPHVKHVMDSLKVKDQLLYHADHLDEVEKYQAMLFCEEEDDEHYIKTFPQFHFVRWHDYSVDALPMGSSKAVGIKKLLDSLDIELKDAYAFGDGMNDKEMLDLIPNSVAMGNAVDEVKKTAKHVTADVEENGIAYGLQKLGLL